MRAHNASALAIFERTGDERSIGAQFVNASILEREIGHYRRALEMLDAAEPYSAMLGGLGVCSLAMNRAEIVFMMGDIPLAFNLSSKALEMNREHDAEERYGAEALHTHGAIQICRGEVEAGLANLYSALENATRGGLERVAGDITCTIVATLVAQGKLDEAERFARDLAKRVLERPARERFPTRACWALAEYDRARDAGTSETWLARGRALLEETLARFELPEDREAFSAMPFNGALLAPRPA
jgi:tetratricopeptide (TPR) repeat protein